MRWNIKIENLKNLHCKVGLYSCRNFMWIKYLPIMACTDVGILFASWFFFLYRIRFYSWYNDLFWWFQLYFCWWPYFAVRDLSVPVIGIQKLPNNGQVVIKYQQNNKCENISCHSKSIKFLQCFAIKKHSLRFLVSFLI